MQFFASAKCDLLFLMQLECRFNNSIKLNKISKNLPILYGNGHIELPPILQKSHLIH